MMKQILSLLSILLLTSIANAQNPVNIPINEDAPVVQIKEITISAEPEEIWEVLTEIEDWSDWNDRIENPEMNEEADTGAEFTWKINGTKIRSQIHTFERNKALGWTGKAFGARAIHNWYLQPVNDGTKVIVKESMEGWLVRLFTNRTNNAVEEDMTYWLEQLKAESEN